MRDALKNTQESQKDKVQHVQHQVSTGGEATIADNRPELIHQRKIRESINTNSQPKQFKRPKGSSRFQKIASSMGKNYGVDTSMLSATHNSSFPSRLNAEATIQGNKIHFAPGMDTDYNIKHEVSHAIDNAINGIPKGDKVINGQRVDTTREKIVDKMAKEPLTQLKEKEFINPNIRLNQSLGTLIPIQRVKETPDISKKYKDLMEMTVTQLLEYTNQQADWHRHVVFPKKIKNIRLLLRFFQDEAGVDGACGDFKVSDLWTNIKSTDDSKISTDDFKIDLEKCEKIKAYTRGVQKKSAHCAKQKDVSKALAFGESILKLEKEIPEKLLAHIFTDKMFELLCEHDPEMSFGNYYKICNPHLAADNGSEIYAYLRLKVDDGVDPVSYDSTSLKDRVRNFHRFEKTALDKLEENFNNTSRGKPLTFILHSQLDHNGAFFRDTKLTELITKPELYVLMIEGKESLANAQTAIDTLLASHAKDGVIDQIMIAGHGNARSIQVAGKTDDYKEDDVDNINLKKGTAFLDHILDKLVDKLGDDRAVVVFNACLTNSNRVDVSKLNLTGDVAQQALAIRGYIRDNPSLATYVSNWATGKGLHIKSIGSSASTTSGGDFVDDKNRLTLEDADDPKFTAPKLEYVKEGIEPTGALRAALETWADEGGTGPALTAIKNRGDKGDSTDWSEQLIQSLFARIDDKYKESAIGIARLVNIAEALSEFTHKSDALYAYLNHYKLDTSPYKEDVLYTIVKLTTTNEYKNRNYIPLGLFQLQLAHDVDKKNELIEQLGNFNMREVVKYPFLDVTKLDLEELIPDTEAKDPHHGQILLAFWAWSRKQDQGKNFLLKHLEDLRNFPAKDNINDILGGWRSENYILIKLGKMESSGPEEKLANVQLDGDTVNKMYVTPMTRKGEVIESLAQIRIKPEKNAHVMYMMDKKDEVNIIGETGGWYAIAYKGKTAFIKKEHVNPK